MPELAEVEFYRKRWHQSAVGQRITGILTHDTRRLLRHLDLVEFRRAPTGAKLQSSSSAAKQMLFRFSGDAWLGIHLGMSGELSVARPDHVPGRHDHLVLITPRHALVFTDPRMFGRVDLHRGRNPPAWWSRISPAILSPLFTVEAVATFLQRRRRAPIKSVLLMQECFPGVGNWMADEILWRAGIHPARRAGTLSPPEVRQLWRMCREVCRDALEKISGRGRKLPADLNANIPPTWLFLHRWKRGGRCPRTGKPLAHATIGGRTTCWSPARQRLDAGSPTTKDAATTSAPKRKREKPILSAAKAPPGPRRTIRSTRKHRS